MELVSIKFKSFKNIISYILSYFLGFVFLTASFYKIIHFGKFVDTLSLYGTLPRWIESFSISLILIEFLTGIGFLIRQLVPVASVIGSILLIGFTTLIIIEYLRGNIGASCGCGLAIFANKINLEKILENISLVVLCLASFLMHRNVN